MALTPTLIIERRRNVLVAEWKQNPLIVVQVESPAVLPVLTFLDDRGQGAGIGAVGRRSRTNTVIVSRPGDPDRWPTASAPSWSGQPTWAGFQGQARRRSAARRGGAPSDGGRAGAEAASRRAAGSARSKAASPMARDRLGDGAESRRVPPWPRADRRCRLRRTSSRTGQATIRQHLGDADGHQIVGGEDRGGRLRQAPSSSAIASLGGAAG